MVNLLMRKFCLAAIVASIIVKIVELKLVSIKFF